MTKFVLIILVGTTLQLISGTLARPDNYQLSEERITSLKHIASQWKGTINLDKNPCEEFSDFVCSNKEIRTPENTNEVVHLRLKLYNENPDLVTEVEEKLRKFTTTCEEFTLEEKEEFIKSFKFDNSIGNWPAFEDKWDDSKFNLPLAIIELNSFAYPAVFAQTLLFDDAFKTYLKINKQELVDIENNKELFKSQFEKLGVKNPEEVLADATLFEKTYNEAAKSKKSSPDLKTTFSELKKFVPQVDLDKQIEKIYGGKLIDNYPVVIESYEELKEIYGAISKLTPKVIANYFFCVIVHNINHIQYAQLAFFMPVFKQTFMKHIHDHNMKDTLKGMYITILEILQEQKIFLDFETHYSSEQIAKFVSDMFVLANDEDLANEFKEVTTNKNECMKNYHRLQQLSKKRTTKLFFSSENAVEILIRSEINDNHIYYSHHIFSEPSPLILETFMFSIMSNLAYHLNTTTFSSARECFAKQFAADVTDDDIINLWGFQLILKAFEEWTKNYPDVVQEEDKILQEYDLSSEKLLVLTQARRACEKSQIFNYVVTALANSVEFPQIYNCPAGSQLNAATKCSFWG